MDRRYPIQAFDPERFAPFFGDSTKLLKHELLPGGACNSNYLVHTPDGQRTLCRLHQRGQPQLEQFVTRIAKDLVPCPDYLWVGDGVSVQTFIDGTHFEPTKELMHQAGELIARLSQFTFERPGDLQIDGSIQPINGWPSYQQGLTDLLHNATVKTYLSSAIVRKCEQLLATHTGTLADFDRCRSLVHGDFRPDNILVANGSIVAVLDWEFSHSGCSYIDIGNLLRHLSPEWERPFRNGLTDAVFELPDDWRFRAALIDLSSHLEFLTSNRSDAFKQQCVKRIEALIVRNGVPVNSG